jgi:hypothetical protein
MNVKEFMKKYRPIQQRKARGLKKYLLTSRIFAEKQQIFGTYNMYLWTLRSDGSIINGRRFDDAVAYLITEDNHDVEEEVVVQISNPKENKYEQLVKPSKRVPQPL